MSDCLVVGGGVVGLSIAYELAGRGCRVRVVDAGQPGREASWAGAGILPPASSASGEPLEQLAALSNRLHAEWAEELRDSTQIDNGFRRSGAIYIACGSREARGLDQLASSAAARNIVAERLTPKALREIEPALAPRERLAGAYFVPQECQIRNPRHLKALIAGCADRGVEISPGVATEDFDIRGSRVRAVRTNVGSLSAGAVCIATGAWSAAVARKLGFTAAVKPIRGQIVLLSLARPVLSRIVKRGSCYLVPRPDGRLLVGSTEEDVGFDRRTTARATGDLLALALGLVPPLETAQLERTWSGLRPAPADGLPYLGRVPGVENAYMAAGHFRAGLQLSTGTAVVMGQLIEGRCVEIDLTGFRLDRDGAGWPPADPLPTRRRVRLH